MERRRWEWCGTYASLKEADRAAHRVKKSLTREDIQQRRSDGQSVSGRAWYECRSARDRESYQIRIKAEPKCYCHISGAALHIKWDPKDCDGLIRNKWEELDSDTRQSLKDGAL